eukprot:scaffold31711_cov59-Phaeocystis_antarctica.AAC.4
MAQRAWVAAWAWLGVVDGPTAKASLPNHFDGAGEAGDADDPFGRPRLRPCVSLPVCLSGAAQTSQQAGACTPAVTVAHLNAAAVSNTAIAPSSSLLPPLSSRRSAGARRVATVARAAAAAAVALPSPQCHFCRRGSDAPGIRTHVRWFRKLPLCSSIHLARDKFSSPSR